MKEIKSQKQIQKLFYYLFFNDFLHQKITVNIRQNEIDFFFIQPKFQSKFRRNPFYENVKSKSRVIS